MAIEIKRKLKKVIAEFEVEGRLLDVVRSSAGHINETYLSTFETASGRKNFVHQRINHNVFKEPEKVMANIDRVTRHARQKILATGGDPLREALTIVPTHTGCLYLCDDEGNYWRTYLNIEGARTYDVVEDLRHVYNASKAFGKFQRMLSDLPGGRLYETIPNFHHTPRRFEAFMQAVLSDTQHRVQFVKPEIDFVLRHEPDLAVIVDGMASGRLPERVTHNDTKLNNVMIDDLTGEGVCVIDLDTVMPGSVLYDFGDSVRIGACTAAEDEQNLAIVNLDLSMFERLTRGYLEAVNGFLTPSEIELLPFSAMLLSLECGIRFLTDYLNGDTYFRIHREHHNLDRCRTQFKMVQDIEQHSDHLHEIVRRSVQSTSGLSIAQ